MILVVALGVGVLFGAGATLMLSRDLARVVAGAILISNSVILFMIASGRQPVLTALQPLQGAELHADPLVQALALTGIVITFGVTALLLGLVIQVFRTHGFIDLERMAEAESREEARIEREREEV